MPCKLCGQRSAWPICGECDQSHVEEQHGKTLEELEDERRASREDELDRRYHLQAEENDGDPERSACD